ncbi:hypothetical protein ROZALSC1DRAFT_28074 [Rozella allomycis CSF55]|uniref:Membrane insertase OXA1/ALB3/YidC domain-containing protein n=1 Tax=Rozella allomycis (strain CSF55) TaxID=988480 RepID=A0A075B0I4_ROZAC|nr:Membrane insertase OXA1/ALB3/YidC domain-containing protein [Rozella allomycis CSF55]RKP20434.1 hypothetical protein ROZALSC1DRAFT_28074 [Rozella allomycis CSF55]|eukprot:EPZ34309.1 Membrane insertase OXA1/ALB3/YidC domain-containing protein [Rozella allomycis CSF55]
MSAFSTKIEANNVATNPINDNPISMTPVSTDNSVLESTTDIVAKVKQELSQLEEPMTEAFSSEFEALGLISLWSPIGWLRLGIESLHSTFGLPWFHAIVIYSVITRLTYFPLNVIDFRNTERAKPYLDEYTREQTLINQLKQQRNFAEARERTRALDKLKRSRGQLSTITDTLIKLSYAAIPMCNFIAFKAIATPMIPSLTTGGYLWFTDLTQPDFTLILPLGYLLFQYIENVIRSRTMPSMSNSKFLMKIRQYGPALFFPFFMMMPSCMALYFFVSRIVSFGITMFLESNYARRLLKLAPKIKSFKSVPLSTPIKVSNNTIQPKKQKVIKMKLAE